MFKPSLWQPDKTLHTISGIEPQLASWYKNTHPTQIRLQAFRQPIMDELQPILPENEQLYLNLDVDVKKPEYLLRHHDLENYLTPLFGIRYLNPARFALVTARKYVGGGSRLKVGIARPAEDGELTSDWNHFSYSARTSIQTKTGKEHLRDALAATHPLALTTPAVEVQIAWKCSARHSWLNLWKPTGDCMGPVLGEENPLRPFAPNDDRIVDLKFHRTFDENLENDVQIDLWWRGYRK